MTSSSTPVRSAGDERDRRILEHVARYRLSTNDVLRKLFFSARRPNAVTKVTARLCRAGLLSKFVLYHPRLYFTVGPQATQRLGLPQRRSAPLGPQSLPTEYAVLAYATRSQKVHPRLSAAELRQQYAWLPVALREFPYCLDRDMDPPALELVRVDLGGKPDHVARKCHADLQHRRPLPEFERLLHDQRFHLVVVTGTAEKAAAIRTAIETHVWPDGLQIRLVVISDLLLLTARTNDNGT
jgi:hypothetical protein